MQLFASKRLSLSSYMFDPGYPNKTISSPAIINSTGGLPGLRF
jgi:hypothetical protein